MSNLFYFLFFLIVGTSVGFAGDDDALRHTQSECSQHLVSFSTNNRAFYNQAEDWLEGLSERKGISHGEDLEAIKHALKGSLSDPSGHVLEIGAGRGRVIRWLLEHFPTAKITAVDQSDRNAERLSEEFNAYSNVNVLRCNILELELQRKFSLALWMWSGFAEISSEEKPKAMERVFQSLIAGGTFVIDMPREIVGVEKIVHGNGGVVQLQESFATLMAHLVTEEELKSMATKAGFEFIQTINYETFTQIPRVSFIFWKPDRK